MSLKVNPLEIPDVKIITTARYSDARGYFTETYNRRSFLDAGITADFVQDNQSLSVSEGTVRGLHFQAPPYAQAKLVRVIQGAILDVAVDVRRGSSTYGKWVSARLTAEGGEQIFVPRGFLHGFATLAPDTVVAYKVDNLYDPASDGSVVWNDPDLQINWMTDPTAAVVSDKDSAAQRFADFVSPF